MNNKYIVKAKNNRLLCFYSDIKNNIFFKEYINQNWTDEKLVISDVQNYFTVNLSQNGDIYIFCQSENGDIVLCHYFNNTFKSRVIFQNTYDKKSKLLFNSLINNDGLTLIYNIPTKNLQEHILAKKSLIEKTWLQSQNIDNLFINTDNLFQIKNISPDCFYVFYQKKEKELQLGYREINKNNIGDFNIFCKTNYNILEQSFLVLSDTIHIIYVVKTMFLNQLIYIKKDARGFSKPIIIYEGYKIKNCSLCIINKKLYINWSINNSLYYCVSENNGESFLNLLKYKNITCYELDKAHFLSFDKLNENYFICDEIYVDFNNPSNIQFIDKMFPTFYEYCSNKQDINQKNYEPKKQFKMIDNFMDNFDNNFIENFKNSEQNNFNQIIEQKAEFSQQDTNYILQNRIKNMEMELTEKTKQILNLNNIIQTKNNERIQIEQDFRQKIKRLQKENQALKENEEILKKQMEKNLENEMNNILNIEKMPYDNNEEPTSLGEQNETNI